MRFISSLFLLVAVTVCITICTAIGGAMPAQAAPSLLMLSAGDTASPAQKELESQMLKALSQFGLDVVSAADHLTQNGLLKPSAKTNGADVAKTLFKFSYTLKERYIIEPQMRPQNNGEWLPSVALIRAQDWETVANFDTFPVPAASRRQIDVKEVEAAAYGLATLLLDRFEADYAESKTGPLGKDMNKIRFAIRGASQCQGDYVVQALRATLLTGESLELLTGRAANLKNYTLISQARTDDITALLAELFAQAQITAGKHYEMVSHAQFIEVRFYPQAQKSFVPCL